MKKRVIIVGGSIAGLTSALVLASAKNENLDFDITVIDEGKPDLAAVAIYNVPLFPQGIKGDEIIEHTKKQIDSLLKIHYNKDKVTKIIGNKGDFTVITTENSFKSDYIILATGAGYFDIQGLGDIIEAHTLMNKPNKIRLKTQGRQMVKEGIYASGLSSGVTTMVASAMGSATEAACAILSDIAGTVSIVHDTPTSRK